MSNQLQEVEVSDNILHGGQMMLVLPSHDLICITIHFYTSILM